MDDAAILQSLKFPIGKFNKPTSITPVILEQWAAEIVSFPDRLEKELHGLTAEGLGWKYRPGSWSIKQLIHHCADSHMNSFIRFKLALTEENPTIKPYFQHLWAELSDGNAPQVQWSVDLLKGLHKRWCYLIKNMSQDQFLRPFVNPEHGRQIMLNEAVGTYAWHGNHHLEHIKLAKKAKGIYNQP